MREYGLVLAGGGAKGAYQIGAWKALREMGITFSAITGVSIGAINGALIASGDFDKALELWSNVEVASGINIPFELKEPKNLFSISNLPQIFYEVIKNGGIDVTPAKELIAKYVDEKKVRNSGIPLGIVTFNLSGFKPVEMFVDEMPEGELVDYLMASARVPGLNRQGPGDDLTYLDGGIYDNAPIGILRDRGINKIIVIDISGIRGVGHKQDVSCANVVYIRPYEPKELGESFEFDKAETEKRLDMGYLDTRKAFGFLYGRQYYFSQKEYLSMQNHYGYKAVNDLERLAIFLLVPRVQAYTEKQFMRAVSHAYNEKVKQNQGHLDMLVKKASALSRTDVSKKLKADMLIDKQFKAATNALDKYCELKAKKQ
ncbi:MAG: patatin-like phospholipase family protein [Oscillospiraceae bacterium]